MYNNRHDDRLANWLAKCQGYGDNIAGITVHVEGGSKKRQFSIITNEKSKQGQCSSEYKLSMVSQHLSQVNVAGIYLSQKVV